MSIVESAHLTRLNSLDRTNATHASHVIQGGSVLRGSLLQNESVSNLSSLSAGETRSITTPFQSCDWQDGLDGHYDNGEWIIDHVPGCDSSVTTLLPLNQVMEALRIKQGGDDLRFFALGDSVLRICIANMLQLNSATVKDECAKYTVSERAVSCTLRGHKTVAHFNWLQWLSPPKMTNSVNNSNDPKKSRYICSMQATDLCHSYSYDNGQFIPPKDVNQTIDSCLAAYFRHAKSTDFLIIRAGLQYAILDSVYADAYQCQRIHHSYHELSHALKTFPDRIKRAFPGKVIWWMLSPFVPPHTPGFHCGPPLINMNASQVAALNEIIEPAVRSAGFGILTKPEKYLLGKSNENIGNYTDCVHYGKSGCTATFTLLFNIMLKMMGGV